jgi:hypothetical protein
MSKEKKYYVFIIQNDDGSLAAGRQIDVDTAIKDAENANEDIEFKVIGRIVEPKGPRTLPMDFNEEQIEWYESDEKDAAFIKRAVNAIVNFIS